MIRLLRRSRLLALVLLLATPALGGAWLQAAHPCPVDAPWAAEHGGDHGGQHGAPADTGTCHCVGSCAASAGSLLPAAAAVTQVLADLPAAPRPASIAVLAPTLRPADRLPPATAPPALS